MTTYIRKEAGGFRKVSDTTWVEPCDHPEHFPPNMIVLEPGCYEWVCPSCGHITRFTVPSFRC